MLKPRLWHVIVLISAIQGCKALRPTSNIKSDDDGVVINTPMRLFIDKLFKARIILDQDSESISGTNADQEKVRQAFAFAARIEITSMKLSQELTGKRLTASKGDVLDVVPQAYQANKPDISPYPLDIVFTINDDALDTNTQLNTSTATSTSTKTTTSTNTSTHTSRNQSGTNTSTHTGQNTGTHTSTSESTSKAPRTGVNHCRANKVWLNAPFKPRCDHELGGASAGDENENNGSANFSNCSELALEPAGDDPKQCLCGKLKVSLSRLSTWSPYQINYECLGSASQWPNSICLDQQYRLEPHPAISGYCRCGTVFYDKTGLAGLNAKNISLCRDANMQERAPSCNSLGLEIMPKDPNQCRCGKQGKAITELLKNNAEVSACRQTL